MTESEFNRWLEGSHAACFPGVSGWMRGMSPPQRDGILKEWWRSLGRLTLTEANDASRALWHEGGCPYGDHPPAILRLAKEFRVLPPVDDDQGPRWEDMTDADKETARGVIADVIKSIGRPEPRPEPTPPPGGRRNYPATVAEAHEMLKGSAIGSYRIETIKDYAGRAKKERRKRGRK